MAREYATQGVGFKVADVVPADFLNRLDDLLYSYNDSVIATHTGTQIYVQATTGDEAQIAINRRYFINNYDVLTAIDGPSSIYYVYAVASGVPTANSTQVSNFDVAVSTYAPNYAYVKEVASVEWDGSAISAVWNNPHKLNAAQLEGYVASDDPAGGPVIPVASSNSKLNRGFNPLFSSNVPVGDVIDYWVPPGGIFSVPDGWMLCDGSVVPSGSHEFGPFDVTLPDLRDRYIIGANPSSIYGSESSATDSTTGAPGISGGKATHFNQSYISHSHTVAEHSHVASHRHSMASHYHNLPTHTHTSATLNWDRAPTGTYKSGVFFDTLAIQDTQASSMTYAGWLKTVPSDAANYTNYTGWVNPSTDSIGAGVASTLFDGQDLRPWFIGFAKIIKVKGL